MRVALIGAGLRAASLMSLFAGMPGMERGVFFDGANDPPADPPAADPPAAKTYTQADIDALIAERNGLKVERDDFKGKHEAAERGKLTEKERAEKERDDAKTERDNALQSVRDARAEAAIAREAVKAGVDPDVAAKLMTVQFDKEGNPIKVAEAIAELVKKHPYLVSQGGSGGSVTNPARGRDGSTAKPKTLADAVTAHYAKN